MIKIEKNNNILLSQKINSSTKLENQKNTLKQQNIINEKIYLKENNIFKNEKIIDNNKNFKDKAKDINKINENNQLLGKRHNIEITFISTDQTINQSITCDSNDIFLSVEKRLYDKNPILSQKGCYFLCNGSIVKKSASLNENRIQNGNINCLYL